MGGYGTWFASKKLLKYGKFTDSGDVWGGAAGILVWQSGQRSSENGFQTTFGLVGKGSSLEDCVRTVHTLRTDSKFCVICK